MLQPTYPGQLHLVAKNLHHVVLVLDLSRVESLILMTEGIRDFISRGIPVRFGLVPLVGEDQHISTLVARVVWYLTETVGRAGSMKLMQMVSWPDYEQTTQFANLLAHSWPKHLSRS